MNTMNAPRKRSRAVHLLLYALALMLVLLSPALGVLAAAVATWQALLAGSVWYMPLGLAMVLAAIAIVQSHKPFDLALLGLLLVAAIVWFGTDALQRGRILDGLQELAARTSLTAGLVLILALALFLYIAKRLLGSTTARFRPIWISTPIIIALSISASADSFVG